VAICSSGQSCPPTLLAIQQTPKKQVGFWKEFELFNWLAASTPFFCSGNMILADFTA